MIGIRPRIRPLGWVVRAYPSGFHAHVEPARGLEPLTPSLQAAVREAIGVSGRSDDRERWWLVGRSMGPSRRCGGRPGATSVTNLSSCD
jgi:hypothetical protein